MTRPGLSFAALAAPAALAVALGLSAVAPGTPAPAVPQADRVRVAEAFRLAEQMGDAIWPGWARVPFALVLVTPDTEFFIRHPSPPSDARPIGADPMLGSEIFARPRTFPTSFLATFPIDGVSTVVVGQAESTATIRTARRRRCSSTASGPPGRNSTSRGCSRWRRASTRRIAEGKPGARG